MSATKTISVAVAATRSFTVRLATLGGLFAALVSCTGSSKPAATAPPAPPPATATTSTATEPPAQPPRELAVPTERRPVTESLHGHLFVDPYRWLEQENNEVSAWVDKQNQLTRSILDKLPGRDKLREDIAKLISVGNLSTPTPKRTKWGTWRYFYTKREAGQNQPNLVMREGLEGNDVVLLDVNALSADGTTALDWVYASPDGSKVAYGISEGGTEESTLHVLQLDRKGAVTKLATAIPRTNHASIAWKPDSTGFYYTRHPAPGEVPKGEEKYHRQVFEHVIGTDPANDPRVFAPTTDMTDIPAVDLSPDGRWLVVTLYQGWAQSQVHLRDLRKPAAGFDLVVAGKDTMFEPVVTNDSIYLLTNENAPRGKLVRVDPKQFQRDKWTPIVPEASDALQSFRVVGSEIIASYLHDSTSVLKRYDRRGKLLGDIALPGLGTARVSGAVQGRELFVGFSSYAVSTEVYRTEVGSKQPMKLWQRMPTPLDAEKVEVLQFKATSKDGTKVPYFVVRNKGLPSDGTAPAIATGYGGFSISIAPTYMQGAAVLLERGGVFVQACLRGGTEYGEAWHKAGMLKNKQNVFDDMIAVTEDIIARKIADPKRIGITGGSNGGLLVGAMITQRPELFRVAVSRVPLLDMLRYQHFLIAKLWVAEYGSSDDPDMLPVLAAYSPYHNVKNGVKYPATLFTAAWGDSRVHPLHAMKMTAAMQYATSSDEPILARIESKAGHGAGKPVSKRIEETADVYGFMMWKLGMLKQ